MRMVYELRTYRLKTGALPQYIRLVAEEGLAIQKAFLGRLEGYWYTDIGPLNQVVHLWSFDSVDDRDKRRAALLQDGQWQAFLPKLQALIEEMETRILRPAPFHPA